MKTPNQFDRALSTAIGAIFVMGLSAPVAKAADAKPEFEK